MTQQPHQTTYTQLNLQPTANRREFAVTFIQAGRVKQTREAAMMPK
jgi:hypothetical protein